MPSAPGESPAAAIAYADWQNSWQPSPNCVPQENFEQEQSKPGRDEPGKQLVMMRELLHFRLGLLQLVDLSIDGLELLGVVGAVVLTAGHIGDFLQHVLIQIGRASCRERV